MIGAQNIQGFPQMGDPKTIQVLCLGVSPMATISWETSICSDQTKPAWTYLRIQHVVRARFPKKDSTLDVHKSTRVTTRPWNSHHKEPSPQWDGQPSVQLQRFNYDIVLLRGLSEKTQLMGPQPHEKLIPRDHTQHLRNQTWQWESHDI